jgi:ABC-type lipoprotein export system ATPase subunit
MTIDGLTTEQCKMLDIMWEKETCDELFEWFQSLSEEKFHMAMTLHNMMLQEVCEDMVKVEDGKQMLKNIGVNVA